MNIPFGVTIPDLMISRTDPRPELKVCQSIEHDSTSANRLTA